MTRNSGCLFFAALVSGWLLFLPSSKAQDSSLVLSKDEFISVVRQFHPVVLQANLQVRRAEAGITQARGAFDPVLYSSLDRKSLDGKLYYSYFNPQLIIPTWYGLQVKAGLEEVIGDRVTSEATFGKTSYLGVKLSSNELLFDNRRAALRQAQTMRSLSQAEQKIAVNDLMNEALTSYLEWLRAYENYRLISDAIRINEERLRFVRLEFLQGNKPAIDTSEVVAQLQNFLQQQNAAWLAFQNEGIYLSNFLWLENARPLQWNEKIIPDTSVLSIAYDSHLKEILDLVNLDISDHPKMELYRSKIEFLETERRLKAQYLAPKLSVNANLLNKGYELPGEVSRAMLENNYKLGVDFSLPLLLREARGAYRTTKLKTQETILARDQEQLSLENKVRRYFNEVVSLYEQIALYESAYQNYVRLYRGEQTRFSVGESTLFILNSRENKLIETQQKLIDLRTKWHKSYTGLLWAAGKFGAPD